MRGNRRYVMSRANRRVAPTDEESSLPSVDTAFLRKLINTGDTGFIDDLVGKESPGPTADIGDATKYNNMKSPKRWPYVLLGMGIMYFFIIVTEARMTKNWWRFYMTNLKGAQMTQYDSAGLRGALNVQTADIPQSSIFKKTSWEQGGAGGSMVDSSRQQQQYPKIQGGLSSGTLGNQQQYPRISGGFSDGTRGESTKQHGDIAPIQPQGNTGGYTSQVSSSSLFGGTNSNGMIASQGGGNLFQSSRSNRALVTSQINSGGNSLQGQYNQQPSTGQLVVADTFGQQGLGHEQAMGRNFGMQP
jgi:hypothetical protein